MTDLEKLELIAKEMKRKEALEKRERERKQRELEKNKEIEAKNARIAPIKLKVIEIINKAKTIKTSRGTSLEWFELDSRTTIEFHPIQSIMNVYCDNLLAVTFYDAIALEIYNEFKTSGLKRLMEI